LAPPTRMERYATSSASEMRVIASPGLTPSDACPLAGRRSLPGVVEVGVVAHDRTLKSPVGVERERGRPAMPGAPAGQRVPAPERAVRGALEGVIQDGVVADDEHLEPPVSIGGDDWLAVPDASSGHRLPAGPSLARCCL